MTSGWRIEWAPLAIIGGVGVVVAIINVTSIMMEGQTGGLQEDPRATWLHELSSVAMVVALSPLIGWMVHRFPPPAVAQPRPWLSQAGVHFLAATAFSFAHVIGMAWIRKLGYASAGSHYVFAHDGDLVFPFIYEWRKDLLTYASNAVTYWGWGFWQAQRAAQALVAEPASPIAGQRIEVRDGARVSLIDPAAIGWVEAAGNYVEIHTRDVTHLVRGTLTGFEERLAEHGFVRIHRSRLINKSRIIGFRPTPSGDLEITLDDGRVVGGSRRFRSLLES